MASINSSEAFEAYAKKYWATRYGLSQADVLAILERRQRFDWSTTLSLEERAPALRRIKRSKEQAHLDFLASRFPPREDEAQWLSVRQKPSPQEFGISWQGAEAITKSWLEYLGESNVAQTQATRDEGVDVVTDIFCCQVKNYDVKPVSVEEVREITGVSHVYGLKPLIFTASPLTNAALEFANRAGVTVVQFHAETGSLSALNDLARGLLLVGKYD